MIIDYIELIEKFVEYKIDVLCFETSFLKMFKNDKELYPDNIYNVLDQFFSDVDMFVYDDELRDNGDLGKEQLRESAQQVLKSLKEYYNKEFKC